MSNSFEPRDTRITARLIAQGAMLEELQAVLPFLAADSARQDARHAILHLNALRRPSLASREKLFKKLSVRYFRRSVPRTAGCFVRAMQATEDPAEAGLLAYTMLLWNDALVFLLGCEWLAPRLTSGPFVVETSDVERELERLAGEVATIGKWGLRSRRRIAQHYLGLVRDCGFASGSARKALRRPFIGTGVVLFAVRLLLGGGEPPARVAEHPLFTAMGLSVSDVIAALTELRQAGLVEFAVQGDVVHLALQE